MSNSHKHTIYDRFILSAANAKSIDGSMFATKATYTKVIVCSLLSVEIEQEKTKSTLPWTKQKWFFPCQHWQKDLNFMSDVPTADVLFQSFSKQLNDS